jgi:hypothetical protein
MASASARTRNGLITSILWTSASSAADRWGKVEICLEGRLLPRNCQGKLETTKRTMAKNLLSAHGFGELWQGYSFDSAAELK